MEEFAQLRERLLSKQAIIDNAQKKLEQQEDDFQHQIQRIYLTIIEQLDAVETEERLKLLHTNEQFHADVTAYYKPIKTHLQQILFRLGIHRLEVPYNQFEGNYVIVASPDNQPRGEAVTVIKDGYAKGSWVVRPTELIVAEKN
ncbi:MAG: nucleotide exchange factor GrpE [Saprospiraceae bacterium]|nr:nucleotide exchange factor GrpE [Saprospiraceae bacterium]MBP7679928.1 nucleotide exchange factor GrpE [Saprospiraceae bacterium]